MLFIIFERRNVRMVNFKKLTIFLIICSLLFLGSSCKMKSKKEWTTPQRITPPTPVIDLQSAFVQVSENIKPAVVNISATRIEKSRALSFKFRSPFSGDPLEEFFKHFFPPEWETRKSRSVGSGVIIDSRGYVLTNYHVIERAKDVQVTIGDGRERKIYKGVVVGTDPRTDISVIKIEGQNKFPVALLGNSDKIKVGEWAIAIGSPFGLEHTVTVGVISAKRQNVSIENRNYEDLIQTDASINPGNSGGPLINIYGEVMGINVAIFTPTGGFVGVGFAIPINKAKEVLADLIKHGKVVRGYLGIKIQEITQELAKSFNVPESKRGVLVSDVLPGSPGEKGGLKRGDVIIQFNEKDIKEPADLQRATGKTPPGLTVHVKVIRANKEILLRIKLGSASGGEESRESPQEAKISRLGLILQNHSEGVLVVKVEDGSIAQNAGIMEGDIIVEINKQAVRNVSDFEKAVRLSGKNILFFIKRGNAAVYIAVRLE
ncbi:peptidase [Candidatus Desantisbacteria bacterium CG_4_10_14_0_8_um_filter_39_17]|uniref:Peptidase n=2 Tax=unclassified Candidatus Desantisiibacteriota TaxID=3106372 RepID=A0A2H9PC15_9BACT|nr:MAG: peptidase [Candidatus Desantisbacteria bacterium CG_4_10_14_0_8_um_filter_39_17]